MGGSGRIRSRVVEPREYRVVVNTTLEVKEALKVVAELRDLSLSLAGHLALVEALSIWEGNVARVRDVMEEIDEGDQILRLRPRSGGRPDRR